MQMKRVICIAAIIATLVSFPLYVFANTYELDNGGVTVELSPRDWEIYTKDNYQEYQRTLGDLYDDFDELFSSGVYEMIVYSKNNPYYWCLGVGSRDELKNFESLTDNEIVETYKSQLPIPVSSGADTGEYTGVYIYTAKDYRFIVFEGTATSGGSTMSVIQFMAPINKKAYVLTAYKDGKNGFTFDEKNELQREVIKKMTFSKPSNLYDENASTEMGSFDYEYWLTKMIVPAVIIIGIWLIRKNIKKTKSNDNTQAEQKIPDNVTVPQTPYTENSPNLPATSDISSITKEGIANLLKSNKNTMQSSAQSSFSQKMEAAAKSRNILYESQRTEDSDYGYSLTNPIMMSTIPRSYEYLNRLRTTDGETLEWERIQSINLDLHDVKGVIVDQYDLFLKGEPYKTIYICPYGHNTEVAPEGMLLSPVTEKTEENNPSSFAVPADTQLKESVEPMSISGDNDSSIDTLENATSVNESQKIPVEELEALKKLYDAGVLTEEEFKAKKKQLLHL